MTSGYEFVVISYACAAIAWILTVLWLAGDRRRLREIEQTLKPGSGSTQS